MDMSFQMEYCENETLRQLIDSGDLHSSEDKVWRLFREIVEGLEHIHSKVHSSTVYRADFSFMYSGASGIQGPELARIYK